MQSTQSNLLKSVALLLGLLLAVTPTLSAGESISVPGSTVTLEAPAGFTPLTAAKIAAEIAAKFPRTRPPGYALGNARRSTSIAYDLKPQAIKDAELEKGLEMFGTLTGRVVAKTAWKRKEIIQMAGQRWIFFELTPTAVDTDIHNIMLITPLEWQMLIFNFNSTKEDFAKQEAALRASVASIHLK